MNTRLKQRLETNGKEFGDYIVLVTHCKLLCFTLNWLPCTKLYQPLNCIAFKLITIPIEIIYKCHTCFVCQDNNYVAKNTIWPTIKT